MSGDLSRYCFEKLPRPIFPLDDDRRMRRFSAAANTARPDSSCKTGK